MKIHHLSCGSFCPAHTEHLLPADHLSCHCLLLESSAGLVLVDTGLPREPAFAKPWLTLVMSHPTLPTGKSAREQVEGLGFEHADVRHIIVTHLDYDHIGGVQDFPEATVHLHANEEKSFENPGLQAHRYRRDLWPTTTKIETYDRFGDNWNGFKAVRGLKGLPEDILLVPLIGHTRGHSGVAVESEGKTVFHAGDAFFFLEDLNMNLRERNIASDLLQVSLAMKPIDRLLNLRRLAKLREGHPEIELINSHDPRLLKSDPS